MIHRPAGNARDFTKGGFLDEPGTCYACGADSTITPAEPERCVLCGTVVVEHHLGRCSYCKSRWEHVWGRHDCVVYKANEAFCNACAACPRVWCPLDGCGYTVGSFGAWRRLAKDSAAYRAQTLTWHVRYCHGKVWKACKDSEEYRSKVPDYDYFRTKAEINNRAARRLLRKFKKLVKSGGPTRIMGIRTWRQCLAFGKLKDADPQTKDLAEKVSDWIDRWTPR